MDRWKASQVILALRFTTSAHGKGLFSGVPCSRSYRCVTESSNVMAEISNVPLEEECQAACAGFSNCVSYTWASERAHELDIEPFLCQLFTSCERSYDALKRVSSGKSGNILASENMIIYRTWKVRESYCGDRWLWRRWTCDPGRDSVAWLQRWLR